MDGAAERRHSSFDDFVGRVLACAEAALRPGEGERHGLGPLTVSFASNEPAFLARFRRGLALRRVEPGAPAWRLDLLVGPAAGVAPPPEWPLPLLCDDHHRRRHRDRDLALASWGEGAVWQVLDRRRRHAVYWARAAADVPEWDLGAPFRTLLAWALEESGLAMVHGAGFGPEGGAGLLVAGAGGAGKSSTSLVALREAGFSGVGDDFVALDAGNATAHALFTTLKLDEPALDRLGVPRAAVANPDRPAGQKARLYQRELLPGRDRARLPLAALAVPRVVVQQESGYRRCDGGLLLRALAPSSLFLLPGEDRRRFADLAALTRRLPCYELLLGQDPSALAAMLRRLLEEASRGGERRG